MTDGDEPLAGRWELLRSESGEEMPLFKVRYDWVRNPRNRREMRRLVLESVDWVNVVAITADGGIVMAKSPPGRRPAAGLARRVAAPPLPAGFAAPAGARRASSETLFGYRGRRL